MINPQPWNCQMIFALFSPFPKQLSTSISLNYRLTFPTSVKMKNRYRNSLFPAIVFLGFLFFSCCIVTFSAGNLSHYVPSDYTKIDCSRDGEFNFGSNHAKKLNIDLSTVSRAYALDPDNRERPDISACTFRNQYTYTFSVSAGPKFVRLYFIPVIYSGFSLSNALFSVQVGRYTLLTVSRSSLRISNDADHVVREFCINVEGQLLNVTFTPTSTIPDSYGFFNKIEIVSMPSKLYIQDSPLQFVGRSSHYSMENTTALETMYRLNVGGSTIPPPLDTGMFRFWTGDDDDFMNDEGQTRTIESDVEIKPSSSTQYAAPLQVYSSASEIVDTPTGNCNTRWSLPVDSGFYYLVRLHFCEISSVIKQNGQRVFNVYINDQTAEDHADIFYWSPGAGIPTFRDYIVNFSRHGQGIMYLSISMRRDKGSPAPPILSGLEVFKLSDLTYNLSGPYPFGVTIHPHRNFSDFQDYSGPIRIPSAIFGSFCAICFLGWLYHVSKSARRITFKEEQSSDCCRIFSIAQIKAATNNFSDSLLIGTGGFGTVYKGSIDSASTIVAIKRANPSSNQGLTEFQTEIFMLSKLRHCHLVSLIGYSMKDKEMILVYDYMAQGTLRDHLCNTQKPPLAWKKRLEICIGAARGLHYLHTGAKNTIIHRDIKSSNILLDENLVAKVSDFGLSKISPSTIGEPKAHVSTLVKGTFGYLDPEYYRRRKLTEKSDVYSFGVVLFEILCARPAVLTMREVEEEEYEKVNLAEWALYCYRMGTLEQIIDPYLNGKIATESFKTFTDIARKCLADTGRERPSMGDVLCNLELAMKQQDAVDSENDKARKEANGKMSSNGSITNYGDEHCICFELSDQTPGVEFSEIIVPTGR